MLDYLHLQLLILQMRITRPLPGCMRNRELVAKSTSCAIEIRRLLLLTMGLIVSLKRLYLVLHIDLYWPFAVMPCSTRYPHHTSVILPSVIWQVATEKWGRSYPVIDSTGPKEIWLTLKLPLPILLCLHQGMHLYREIVSIEGAGRRWWSQCFRVLWWLFRPLLPAAIQ